MRRKTFLVDAIAGSVGFHNFYGQEDMPRLLDYHTEDRKLGWDYDALMFMFDKVNELKKPFLSYVYASTDHTPFPDFPAPFNKYPADPNGENGYLNSLHYTDWAIGELIKKAKKEEWFDNTLFVVVGDHAIAHFRSGAYLEYFQVPLIIYGPKILQPRTVDTVVSQLDLMPTFIDLLNMEGRYTTLGENMLEKKTQIAMVRQGSVVGIITDKGYLRHSLKTRLETKSFDQEMPPEYFDGLERQLLSWDSIAYKLIQSNRWAR